MGDYQREFRYGDISYEPTEKNEEPRIDYEPIGSDAAQNGIGTKNTKKTHKVIKLVLAVIVVVVLPLVWMHSCTELTRISGEMIANELANPDPQPHDSTEARELLDDVSVTTDDIRIAKVLEYQLYNIYVDSIVPAGGSKPLIHPSEYIAYLEDERRWPSRSQCGWDEDRRDEDPKALIRLSILCENAIEAQEGGRWETRTLSYPQGTSDWFSYHPFGADEPIIVIVQCVEGTDKGRWASVSYYRFEDARIEFAYDTSFEDNLQSSRYRREVLFHDAPSLADRNFLVVFDYPLMTDAADSDEWDFTMYLLENQNDTDEGYPLRRQEAYEKIIGEILGNAPADVRDEVDVRVRIVPFVENVCLIRNSSSGLYRPHSACLPDVPIVDAQELLDTGFYDGLFMDTDVYRFDRTYEFYDTEEELEAALGVSLEVPLVLHGYPITSYSIVDKTDPYNMSVVRQAVITYGEPDSPTAQLSFGASYLDSDFPTSKYFGGTRMHENTDAHGRIFHVHDLFRGITIECWDEESTGSIDGYKRYRNFDDDCMLHLSWRPSEEEIREIVSQIDIHGRIQNPVVA